MASIKVRRGEFWWVKLDPAVGSEAKKTRPCLVVQRDSANLMSPTAIVCPATAAGDGAGDVGILDEGAPFDRPLAVGIGLKGEEIVDEGGEACGGEAFVVVTGEDFAAPTFIVRRFVFPLHPISSFPAPQLMKRAEVLFG